MIRKYLSLSEKSNWTQLIGEKKLSDLGRNFDYRQWSVALWSFFALVKSRFAFLLSSSHSSCQLFLKLEMHICLPCQIVHSLFVLLKIPHTALFPPIQSLASCTVDYQFTWSSYAGRMWKQGINVVPAVSTGTACCFISGWKQLLDVS